MEHVDPWFDNLYTRYAPTLLKTAYAILGNYAIAEELTHDVFVILLMKRAEIEQYRFPNVWLFQTLHNRIGNEMQRARYTKEVPLEEPHNHYAAAEDFTCRLEDVLPKGLTSEERQFLIWCYEDNLSHEEIAKRLGISVHACHSRLYRLKQKCFRLFQKEK